MTNRRDAVLLPSAVGKAVIIRTPPRKERKKKKKKKKTSRITSYPIHSVALERTPPLSDIAMEDRLLRHPAELIEYRKEVKLFSHGHHYNIQKETTVLKLLHRELETCVIMIALTGTNPSTLLKSPVPKFMQVVKCSCCFLFCFVCLFLIVYKMQEHEIKNIKG